MSTHSTFLDALTQRGLLLSVSVRYWRARKKLRPEDLGLDPDTVDDRLFSLGHKRPLPKEALQKLALVESRAHALVEASTFPFLGGVARYLPNAKLEQTYARLHGLESEFSVCRDEFLSRYADLRTEAMREWRGAAERLKVDPARLLAVVSAAFPDRDKLARHFGFNIRTFQLAMPEALPTRQLVEMGTQEEIIEARRQAAKSAKAEIESSCREFIADCTATLREQTAKLCGEMLETIRTTGNVHQKTLNRLVNFIDTFSELNFMDDADMAAELDAARRGLLERPASEYRDSRYARNQLVNGLNRLRSNAAEMAHQDVSGIVENFGQFGQRRFMLAA